MDGTDNGSVIQLGAIKAFCFSPYITEIAVVILSSFIFCNTKCSVKLERNEHGKIRWKWWLLLSYLKRKHLSLLSEFICEMQIELRMNEGVQLWSISGLRLGWGQCQECHMSLC